MKILRVVRIVSENGKEFVFAFLVPSEKDEQFDDTEIIPELQARNYVVREERPV